jgi:hypothetical protein
MLFSASRSNINENMLKIRNYNEKLRRELGLEMMLFESNDRYYKYISKPSINGNIVKYYKQVSPKPRSIVFGDYNRYTMKVFYTPEEQAENAIYDKMIADSKNIIQKLG